jgi:GH43 family beta-xylosidase
MKRFVHSYVLVLVLVVVTANCKKPSTTYVPPPYVAPQDTTFSNPLLSSGPDPWVIKKDSMYYYTHTSGDRIRVWRTKSMSQLKNASDQVIWSKPATGPNSQNVWAPELHFLDGKWYAYYTAGATTDQATQRMFVLENTSADPWQGTWADKGKIADAAADFFAIDATVFEHNANRYILWSGHASATDKTQRLYIARLSNPWTMATSRVAISSPQYTWEMIGAPPAVNEGPEILKGPTGKVFLVYSASGCWTDDYALGMMTLKDGGDPMNPADWTKTTTPVFTKSPANGAFGPGHNAFFKSPDGTEDWIIYHANPSAGLQCGDARSPRIQKFTWNADGTPAFGQPVPINTKIRRPSGEKD